MDWDDIVYTTVITVCLNLSADLYKNKELSCPWIKLNHVLTQLYLCEVAANIRACLIKTKEPIDVGRPTEQQLRTRHISQQYEETARASNKRIPAEGLLINPNNLSQHWTDHDNNAKIKHVLLALAQSRRLPGALS